MISFRLGKTALYNNPFCFTYFSWSMIIRKSSSHSTLRLAITLNKTSIPTFIQLSDRNAGIVSKFGIKTYFKFLAYIEVLRLPPLPYDLVISDNSGVDFPSGIVCWLVGFYFDRYLRSYMMMSYIINQNFVTFRSYFNIMSFSKVTSSPFLKTLKSLSPSSIYPKSIYSEV